MPRRSDRPKWATITLKEYQEYKMKSQEKNTMLERLKSFDIERMDLEEAIALSAFGRALQSEYAQHTVEPPEWLGIRTKEIQREIKSRNQDALEKRLRELKARKEGLEDAATRRQKVETEIADLEAKLQQA